MKSLPVFFLVCLISLAGLCGCSIQKPRTDPALDAAAQAAAEAVRNLNRDITTSKGLARLQLETANGIQTFQMAWAAQPPDRLRLTFTALASPVETVVADGRQVTFVSHTGRHRPHTTASSDPDLEPYTGVPLKLSDLICLLSGQVPVQPFYHAWFSPDDPDLIQLTGRFASQFQELIPAPDRPLKSLRLKNRRNELRCEIRYHRFDVIDSRLIPMDLTIADGTGQQARMTITRFWSDIPVKESVFQLTPFGS
jgi:hypothetical protein